MPPWAICERCGTTDTMSRVEKTFETERDDRGFWYLVHVSVYECQLVGCDHTYTRREPWLIAPKDSRLLERRWREQQAEPAHAHG